MKRKTVWAATLLAGCCAATVHAQTVASFSTDSGASIHEAVQETHATLDTATFEVSYRMCW